MQATLKRAKNYLGKSLLVVRKNRRYVAAAGIFVVALYYHFAIVPPPENTDAKSKDDATTTVAMKQSSDLDIDHPLKRYDRQLLSRQGDWYRVGVVARSLDGNESLRVSLASSVGRMQEVGRVDVTQADGEKYAEFVVMTDGSYEDVVVEKVVAEGDKNVWQGGQVRLNDVSVSRLDVATIRDIKSLLPTVFGERDTQTIATSGGDVMLSGIHLPVNAHFIQGQVFDVPEDAYLLSANMRINQNNATGTGKYRLELREYDSARKKVGDKVLRRDAFALKDLKTMTDADGSYRFALPYRLEAGKAYFVGVSDDYVVSAKKIKLETFQDNSRVASSGAHYFVLSTVKRNDTPSGNLLTHAVIEDMGSHLQYRYQSNHEVTDMMDIFASSDDVSFDSDTDTVAGKENAGAFFTYKIDTLRPFDTIRMVAEQLDDNGKQIRMEYSFDSAFWKEIPATRQEEPTDTFDVVLRAADTTTKTLYIRVSYAGSKEGKGVFGLQDFRVTATLPK